ncbi:MAG: NAD-binding protein [Pseudomonadota bacterium]
MGLLQTYSLLAKALTIELYRHLRVPLSLLALVFCAGTLGYWLMGHGQWSLFNCAYMTSITLTTVGYGEVLEPFGARERLFTMGLMWTGMGVTLYALSTVTAFLVEERLSNLVRERKMEMHVSGLKGHFIVCGAGRVGRHVIEEMVANQHPVVVIDDQADSAAWLKDNHPSLPTVHGDATDEGVLKSAGLERALGLVAALPEDSQNMLITVQARFVNPGLKIGTRCHNNNLVDKFYRAGANYVVNTDFIGGMRIASEMIRPQVVSFLDRMLRGQDPTVRVAEVTVREGSELAGQNLEQARLYQRSGLLAVAVKHPDRPEFVYNPSPQERLGTGTVLIVIGNPQQIASLEALCQA